MSANKCSSCLASGGSFLRAGDWDAYLLSDKAGDKNLTLKTMEMVNGSPPITETNSQLTSNVWMQIYSSQKKPENDATWSVLHSS